MFKLDSGNTLAGSIPSSLTTGNLPYLNGLFLDQNRLTGNIPAALFQFTTLVTLHLVSSMQLVAHGLNIVSSSVLMVCSGRGACSSLFCGAVRRARISCGGLCHQPSVPWQAS